MQPNELAKEQPYIARNIAATAVRVRARRHHVASHGSTTRTTSPTGDLDGRQPDDLDNARLWDPTGSRATSRSSRACRRYYQFPDVDIDRYTIDGQKTQVLIVGPRARPRAPARAELDEPAPRVHARLRRGRRAGQRRQHRRQPSYVLSDIPPQGRPDARARRSPRSTSARASAATRSSTQAARARGDERPRRRRRGTRAPAASSCRASCGRAAFALRFGDWNLLDLRPGHETRSRIIYRRDVTRPRETAAPFLKFDADPYPVIIDGRILWVLDAYTTTEPLPVLAVDPPAASRSAAGSTPTSTTCATR